MKLIDLLVQELPKLGGWPDGAEYARVSYFGVGKILVDFRFPDAYGELSYCIGVIARNLIDTGTDVDYHMIRRDSYESALSASQKPAWSGECLPPIGMHCEIVDPDGVLMYGQGESGEVISHVENTAVIRMSYGLGCFEARFLRPLRTEAERKRDAAIEAMQREADEGDNWFYSEYEIIYDAIAAGKIPGVTLDD